MTVYFISGLAADRTVFKYIRLPHGFEAVYLDWISPLHEETLKQYAHRLAEKIDTQKPFGLVGLSFGGMLAVELAKTLQPTVVILISSIPSIQHLPSYFRFAGRMRLHKVIPVSFIRYGAILKRFFTTETPEDKLMLKHMIRQSDTQFIRWAMHAVLTWTNTDVPATLVHIHGTRDEILPNRFTKPTHLITGGGHLMVLNQAKEINAILHDEFAKVLADKRPG